MIDIYEIIGYSGSLLIAISLMMKNILKLRLINFFGASSFALYGYLVSAYPVLILNSFIAVIDIIYLAEMLKQKEHFTLIPVLDNSHQYLKRFFEFHENEIMKFFPDFKKNVLKQSECFFILRNLIPAGLFVFESKGENEAFIWLDYAVPDYRDFKNAAFVFKAEHKFLKEKGISRLVTKSNVRKHIKYLLNSGFKRDKNNPDIFSLDI
jgi:hypothetical protein